jgi:hypothetical protein
VVHFQIQSAVFTTVGVLALAAALVTYFWLRPTARLTRSLDDFYQAANEHEINWIEVRCTSRTRLNDRSGTFIETGVIITGLLETRPILRLHETWTDPVGSENVIEAMNLIEPTSQKILAKVVLLVKAFRDGMSSAVRIRLILWNLPEGHSGEYTEYGQIMRLVGEDEKRQLVFHVD